MGRIRVGPQVIREYLGRGIRCAVSNGMRVSTQGHALRRGWDATVREGYN